MARRPSPETGIGWHSSDCFDPRGAFPLVRVSTAGALSALRRSFPSVVVPPSSSGHTDAERGRRFGAAAWRPAECGRGRGARPGTTIRARPQDTSRRADLEYASLRSHDAGMTEAPAGAEAWTTRGERLRRRRLLTSGPGGIRRVLAGSPAESDAARRAGQPRGSSRAAPLPVGRRSGPLSTVNGWSNPGVGRCGILGGGSLEHLSGSGPAGRSREPRSGGETAQGTRSASVPPGSSAFRRLRRPGPGTNPAAVVLRESSRRRSRARSHSGRGHRPPGSAAPRCTVRRPPPRPPPCRR
jgi:hypothetical protein